MGIYIYIYLHDEMMKLYEDKANNMIWVTFSKGIFLNGRTPKSSKIDKWFAEKHDCGSSIL